MEKVCCAIEMEPRTLNQGQLSTAREAAVDVVQKMEGKDGFNIIKAQGVGGVGPIKEAGEGEEDEEEEIGCIKGNITQLPCQCLCINIDSPDQLLPKEPLSAPF